MISFDEFKKVEIRAGKILSAEKIPETDKLLKLTVDFGEFEEIKSIPQNEDVVDAKDITNANTGDVTGVANTSKVQVESVKKIPKPRQIVSGIALKFPDPTVLIGKTCMFVANLEPRMIKGYESNGMLFAVSTPEGGFSLLEPNNSIPPGTLAV